MMRSDYIMRLIQQLGQALGGVMDLRQSGQPEEALEAVDRALHRLFGLTLPTAEATPADKLIALIRLTRPGSPEPDMAGAQLAGLGSLLQEAAAVEHDLGDSQRAVSNRLKALEIFLTVLTEDPGASPRAAAAVGPLLEDLAEYDLPIQIKDQLWRYYESTGDFAEAENWLFALLDDERSGEDVVERGLAFYDRLSSLSDPELEQGNLPRDEVEAGLAQLEAMQL